MGATTALAVATALVVWTGTAEPAAAADPAAGSVSDSSRSTSYTSGPFTVPNATGTAGDVVCGPASPCDDYALTVSTPAGYGTTHQLEVKTSWAVAAADFDVYVLDSAGAVIGSAASSSDPETILLPPDSGRYTVRIVPFLPLGQSTSTTISLVSKPTNPPPATTPAASYRNYAAPDGLPRSHDAGEPSIGANWKSGALMYQAYTATYKVTFDDRTSPAAATWADKSATPPKCTAAASLDPILYTDPVRGRTFESQLAGKTALTCFTDDDGETWTPTSGSGINSGVDHQTIGGGPFSKQGVGGVTSDRAVYYCSQDIADALCAVSRDGGLTYGPAVPMYDLTQCGGLHGHVKVAEADGTVYVPNKGCGGNQAVAVSTDNGTTWAVRKVPTSSAGHSDPSVGIGRNGTVYFGYQNADGHARVAVSHDQGRTWGSDQDVGAQLGVQNVVFPAVTAGDDDRASFAFLGTTAGGNSQDPAFPGVWHLYVATTVDGGRSWRTVDATPSDPVQRGSICTGGTTCGQDRNLLDFMDVTVDKEGRALVGYADGCTGACATGGAQNYDALATIARQSGGPRLFAAYDPKPDLTVGPASVAKSGNSTRVSASVRNVGAAAATGVTATFWDGSTLLGTTGATSLAPGGTATLSLLTSRLAKGTHVLTAVVDAYNTVAESNETNNKSRSTVRV